MSRFASLLVVSWVLGCATVGGTSARAAEAPVTRTKVLTAKQLVSLRWASEARIAPRGDRVAYVLNTPRADDEDPGRAKKQIWLVSRAGGDARPFTSAEVRSSGPKWSPDGRYLAYLSKRPPEEHTQVYIAPIDGGEPRRLTESKTGVSRFEWSPDGSRIAYSAVVDDEEEREKNKADGSDVVEDDASGKVKRLWTVGVASAGANPVTAGKWSVDRFTWSPDSQRLAIKASERPDTDAGMMYGRLFVVAAKGGKLEPLCKTEGKLGPIAWSPDGSQVAYLGAVDLSDPTAGVVFVVPAAGGEPRALTTGFAGTGQWLDWLDSRVLAFSAAQGTQTTVHQVAARGGPVKTLIARGPMCRSLDLANDRRTYACTGSTPEHPSEVFRGKLRTRKLVRLSRSNPQLAQTKLGAQEVIRWKAKDGLEIAGVLTRPVGFEPNKRYPLAVLVHGGPEGVSLNGWNSRATYPVQLFAARGFVVLEPNYRGSSGRGVEFGKADQKDLGGKEFEDVLAGVDHLVKLGLVDRDRVGMGGWSYGGYFSALAATQHSARFRATMVGAAITNWISFTGTTDIEHENSLVHWGLWPWDALDLAWKRSPLAHAKGSKTATLIVHGLDDARVPPSQSRELFRALRHGGTKTRLLMYPREGHGLSENGHQLHYVKQYVDWFERHVKGSAKPG